VHVWQELTYSGKQLNDNFLIDKSNNLVKKLPPLTEILKVYKVSRSSIKSGISTLSSIINKISSYKNKIEDETLDDELKQCKEKLASINSLSSLNQTNLSQFLDTLSSIYSSYVVVMVLAEDIVKDSQNNSKETPLSEEEIEQNDIINLISDIIAGGIEFIQEETVDLLYKTSKAFEIHKSKNSNIKIISDKIKEFHEKIQKKKMKKKGYNEENATDQKGLTQSLDDNYSAKKDKFLQEIIERFEDIEETTQELIKQADDVNPRENVRSIRKWSLETEFTNIRIGEIFKSSDINVSREIVASLKESLVQLASVDNEKFLEGMSKFKDIRRGIPQPRKLSNDPVLKLVANIGKNLRDKTLEGNLDALKLVFEIAVVKLEHYQTLESQSFLLSNQQKIEDSIENGQVILQMTLSEWIAKLDKFGNDIDVEFLINYIKILASRNKWEAFEALFEFTKVAMNNEHLKQKVFVLLNDVINSTSTALLLFEWKNLSLNECCKKMNVDALVVDKVIKNLKLSGNKDIYTERHIAFYLASDYEEKKEQINLLVRALVKYAKSVEGQKDEIMKIVKVFARVLQVNPVFIENYLTIFNNSEDQKFAKDIISKSQEFLQSNDTTFIGRSYEHVQVQTLIEKGFIFLHGLSFNGEQEKIKSEVFEIISSKSACTCFSYNEKSSITEFYLPYGIALIAVEGTIHEWDYIYTTDDATNLSIDKFIQHSIQQLESKFFNEKKERFVYNQNRILISKQKYIGFVIFEKQNDKFLLNGRMITDSSLHKLVYEFNKKLNFPVYIVELPDLTRKLASYNPMYERYMVQRTRQVNLQSQKLIEELEQKKTIEKSSSTTEIDSVISQKIQEMAVNQSKNK
ncbi:MAG: hypothetical protein N3E37_03065, partial [Candidatus Micrarchaeota archaeon]|nr:hypothetical protein [Candidatus Micrarchaeota archaeon]